MYVLSADTFTIQQTGTRKTAFQREQPLKTFQTTGFAQHVELEKSILKRNADITSSADMPLRRKRTRIGLQGKHRSGYAAAFWPVDNLF